MVIRHFNYWLLFRLCFWNLHVRMFMIDTDIELTNQMFIDSVIKTRHGNQWNEYYCTGEMCCICGGEYILNRTCCLQQGYSSSLFLFEKAADLFKIALNIFARPAHVLSVFTFIYFFHFLVFMLLIVVLFLFYFVFKRIEMVIKEWVNKKHLIKLS